MTCKGKKVSIVVYIMDMLTVVYIMDMLTVVYIMDIGKVGIAWIYSMDMLYIRI